MDLASILNGPTAAPPAEPPAEQPQQGRAPEDRPAEEAPSVVSSRSESTGKAERPPPEEGRRYLDHLVDDEHLDQVDSSSLPPLTRHPYPDTRLPASPEPFVDSAKGVNLDSQAAVWSAPLNDYVLATRKHERQDRLDGAAEQAERDLELAKDLTAQAGLQAEALANEKDAEQERQRQEEADRLAADQVRQEEDQKKADKARVEEERRLRRNALQQAARERKRQDKLVADKKREEDNARRRAEREAAKVAKLAAAKQAAEEAAAEEEAARERAGPASVPAVNGHASTGDVDMADSSTTLASAAPAAGATDPPTAPHIVEPVVDMEVDQLDPSPELSHALPPGSKEPAKRKASTKRKRVSEPPVSASPPPPLPPSAGAPASVPGPVVNGTGPSYSPAMPPPPVPASAHQGSPVPPPDAGPSHSTPATSTAVAPLASTSAVPLDAKPESYPTGFLPSGKRVSPAVARGGRAAWGYDLPWCTEPYTSFPDSLDMSLPLDERIFSNPRVLAEKRWAAVEDKTRTVWTQIAKKDIPKVQKVQQSATSSRALFAKRLSTLVSREARRILTRTKAPKEVQTKSKRVMRELLTFYRGNEKRERDTKKKAEKEALDKARKEEEMREAKRAARKLNFLITQTELYSHFVGNKIKTKEAEESEDTAGAAPPQVIEGPESSAAAADLDAEQSADATGKDLVDIDFDDDDETNLRAHAARNAQQAVAAAKERAQAFDNAAAESNKLVTGIDIDRDDLNFQNPTMAGDLQVKQPNMLMAELKEYQLKGLNWLANLYEQGINGILADEMGLGKTVQSISLMAYLAEVHNIWGPFLVIAPASTLHNWQQEISRFVPALKPLPYWGNVKDRAVLRKFWNRKSLRYDKDAPFHVLITSYQLVVADEKYFQRVKWQYMILDEAQAIKSSGSTRWKTLLGFHCRNRLLLTGTPIQNSMTELWALLHFIMPQLFDSHDEFSEWFSKDIESSADKAGGMNEHQLRRLHMILKPFMLRRIKKNVQNELGDKIEIDVACGLTPRQKVMYSRLRENMSIADLVQRATSLNNDDTAVKRLMNLIMQFRKVCNHPELFERADVTAPLSFTSFNSTANPARDPDFSDLPYSVHSLIQLEIPKTLYRDAVLPGAAGSDSVNLQRLMNIWTPQELKAAAKGASAPGWASLVDLSSGEVADLAKESAPQRVPALLAHRAAQQQKTADAPITDLSSTAILPKSATLPNDPAWRNLGLPPLGEIGNIVRESSRMHRPDFHFFPDNVIAPPAELYCSDRSFVDDQKAIAFDPTARTAMFGLSSTGLESPVDVERYENVFSGLNPRGVIGASSRDQLGRSVMQVPQLEKLMLDSGKLARLDTLLHELKAGGHRVLIYFQMTKMIDLMEEYLSFRQYKYLRLDGGSSISERRDMVMDWQTRPDLFIFLLSTRAGGLGINLTAADTVVFYDSDWNPSNDQQAMDRAHRLGQKRQVTVYRLITTGTIDERILKLARTKKTVQDAVVGSSSQTTGQDVAKPNEVVSLLLDEEELEAGMRAQAAKRDALKEKQIANGQRGVRIREERKAERLATAASSARSSPMPWGTDDDDEAFSFFATQPTNGIQAADGEDELSVAKASESVGGGSSSGGGGKRRGGGGASRKRKAPATGPDAEPARKKKSKLSKEI